MVFVVSLIKVFANSFFVSYAFGGVKKRGKNDTKEFGIYCIGVKPNLGALMGLSNRYRFKLGPKNGSVRKGYHS
jgi:hypothetical protein